MHALDYNLQGNYNQYILNMSINFRGVKMENPNNGYIKIKLANYMEKNEIKKGKLAFKAEFQRTQLNNWIKGDIAYVDLCVLARLCKALNCKVEDILEFIDTDRG